MHSQTPLLQPGKEPEPFGIVRAGGGSPYLLTCDHASPRLPLRLGTLGLTAGELANHIAWDIGAAGVARHLAEALDAFLILQNYSRLAVDCNRPVGSAESIVALSERTRIPGNEAVSAAAAAQRRREIFQPYHDRIAAELDRRSELGRPTLLLALHSFTPVYRGTPRPWHLGLLYHRDPRLARILIERLRGPAGEDVDWIIGDNEPYSVDDETDYTLPVHGERRGIPHAGLEIRQDLIGDASGQLACARRLTPVLMRAARIMGEMTPLAISPSAAARGCSWT